MDRAASDTGPGAVPGPPAPLSGDDALRTRTILAATATLVVGTLSGRLAASGQWHLERQTSVASVAAPGVQVARADAKKV